METFDTQVILQVLGGLMFVSCAISYLIKTYRAHKYSKLDPTKDYEKIYHYLCCYDFPWECFYGINFAFYRTFSSPTISGLYHSTKTIELTTEKRVYDTDILMHAWIDYGIESDEGRRSWEHLNKIHGSFAGKHRNSDFVYVLCCFMVDTIRFIDLFGSRKLTEVERQAIFHFWIHLGERMNLQNMPTSLENAYKLVEDYVNSDTLSKETKGGISLTTAITNLIKRWYFFVPSPLIELGVPSLLCVIGGKVFVSKLGLKPMPWMNALILSLGSIRGFAMKFFPPRFYPHRLSDQLMKSRYSSYSSPLDFTVVGPKAVLAKINAS